MEYSRVREYFLAYSRSINISIANDLNWTVLCTSDISFWYEADGHNSVSNQENSEQNAIDNFCKCLPWSSFFGTW